MFAYHITNKINPYTSKPIVCAKIDMSNGAKTFYSLDISNPRKPKWEGPFDRKTVDANGREYWIASVATLGEGATDCNVVWSVEGTDTEFAAGKALAYYNEIIAIAKERKKMNTKIYAALRKMKEFVV
jgi:nitrous oxide reductase accessory protein NosL